MKNDHGKKVRDLEAALVKAHRRRRNPKPRDSFERDVMYKIRGIGPHPLERTANGTESRMVWSFAAASCLLALIFLTYALTVDFSGLQYQVAQFAVDDPSTFMLTESFAVI